MCNSEMAAAEPPRRFCNSEMAAAGAAAAVSALKMAAASPPRPRRRWKSPCRSVRVRVGAGNLRVAPSASVSALEISASLRLGPCADRPGGPVARVNPGSPGTTGRPLSVRVISVAALRAGTARVPRALGQVSTSKPRVSHGEPWGFESGPGNFFQLPPNHPAGAVTKGTTGATDSRPLRTTTESYGGSLCAPRIIITDVYGEKHGGEKHG